MNDNLEIEQVSESGDYVALLKFLKLGEEKVGLEKSFKEYRFMFNDNVVNVEEDECDWLVVYEGSEIIASYAVSNSNDHIYINDDGNRVLIN